MAGINFFGQQCVCPYIFWLEDYALHRKHYWFGPGIFTKGILNKTKPENLPFDENDKPKGERTILVWGGPKKPWSFAAREGYQKIIKIGIKAKIFRPIILANPVSGSWRQNANIHIYIKMQKKTDNTHIGQLVVMQSLYSKITI